MRFLWRCARGVPVLILLAVGLIAETTSPALAGSGRDPLPRFGTSTSAHATTAPSFTGTWTGTYSLVVNTGGSCGTLPAVTGPVTFTLSQSGSVVRGRIALVGAYIYWNGSCQIYKRDNTNNSWPFVITRSGRTALGEGFRLTLSANGTSLTGDYINNLGNTTTFTVGPRSTGKTSSPPTHPGCFDCIYIYRYFVSPQPQYGQLACAVQTTSKAGSTSPIIGPQRRTTTQEQRQWVVSFDVTGINCGNASFAAIGVRVDNANLPVQVISATVNGHVVNTGNAAQGSSVALPAGTTSFTLSVRIQANSGNYFAGDLDIIVELGPSGSTQTSGTWKYDANNGDDVFVGSSGQLVPIVLSCDSTGHCTGGATSSDMSVTVVLQFSGTTATVTETDTFPTDPFEDVTYQGTATTIVEATGQPADYPQADSVSGQFATATYSTGVQQGTYFWEAYSYQ